jgi:CVNH domain
MTSQGRRIGWAAGVLLLSIALPAMPQGAGSAGPQGSYLKTCSQIRFDGRVLAATCNVTGGGLPVLKKSSIDATACEGDIWNNVGVLYCYARRGTWGRATAIPRGSYIDSCAFPSVSGTVLKTQCKGRDGRYKDTTSLELKACHMGSNISNIDGQLVCIN